MKLYDEVPDPNNLIDEAEEMAASDIDALEDTFFQKMIGVGKLADRHYRDIKIALRKILNEPSTYSGYNKPQSLFSNLPSGFLPKITTLRHRITNHIRNYLSGNFTLSRGWTLLTILLYSLSFIFLLYFHITIMVSGQ
ncbi:MAG: hypothetical protein K2F71_07160 [Paramuribaculum sp.]|nr:hypothetical protein [Paramuribaculum sp.]